MLKRFWDWLCSWFVRKTLDETRLDLYQPKERAIFRFFDGKEIRAADPVVIFKRLANVIGDLEADVKGANSPLKQSLDLHGSAIDKMRYIFEVKPLSEGGLGDLEVSDLFVHYQIYCAELKKNTKFFPTLPTTTFSTSKPCSAESLPTESSSASGSTEIEPKPEEAPLSSMESASL